MKVSPRILRFSRLARPSRRWSTVAGALALAACATLATAQAQFTTGTISGDFKSDTGGASLAPTSNTVVPSGVFNTIDAGANVPVNASGIALNDSNGVLTNVTLAYTANGSFNVDPYLSAAGKANSPNLGLLEDFVFSNSTTAPSTVTFSGLSANTTYNLYVYTGGNSNGRQTVLTLGGVTQTSAYSDADTTFVNGDNYSQYLGVSPTASGTLTFTYAAGNGGEGDVDGFQLVAIPAAAPEPSAVALLALGGALAAGFAWRRRRA